VADALPLFACVDVTDGTSVVTELDAGLEAVPVSASVDVSLPPVIVTESTGALIVAAAQPDWSSPIVRSSE